MSNGKEIKIQVIQLLESLPVYIPNSTGIQHVVRCPFCGDSANLTHGHLSIKINLESDEPMVFRCFKCDVSGLVSNALMEELGLTLDSELYSAIKSYNKSLSRNLFKYNFITEAPKLEVPIYQDNQLNRSKLEYVRDRIGCDLSYEDAHNLKLILNIFDFVKLNNITHIPNISNYMINLLNNDYVGFLSSNNNLIGFRNIKKNNNKRYIKVILQPNSLNPYSFFNIPNTFDIMYNHPVNVHLAEGQFDILSIYKNVNNNILQNNYYFAASGFGYANIIKYILRIGLNTQVSLHIYADKDKNDYEHMKYLRPMMDRQLLWFDNIYMHRNHCITDGIQEKDYGVPSNRIDDKYRYFKRNGSYNKL